MTDSFVTLLYHLDARTRTKLANLLTIKVAIIFFHTSRQTKQSQFEVLMMLNHLLLALKSLSQVSSIGGYCKIVKENQDIIMLGIEGGIHIREFYQYMFLAPGLKTNTSNSSVQQQDTHLTLWYILSQDYL